MPISNVTEFTAVEFDFLIIGGGTAGLALAARLSEDPTVTVGVVEAGAHHENVPEIMIPGLGGRALANPKYDWTFFTVPQSHAQNRVFLQPRGFGLGGTSLINLLCLHRPAREEYDVLEEFGILGWSWADILMYMKKTETTILPNLSQSDVQRFIVKPETSFHGMDGPLKKSIPTELHELQAMFFESAEVLEHPRNPESLGGNNAGAFTCFTTVDSTTAARTHSAGAFYEPNSTRSNLLVLTEAQVTKVILEPTTGGLQKAVGVEFSKGGVLSELRGVKKEVIICAGSFKTPQILELSGIGSKNILETHGITPIIDLPGVGENLQDHVFVPTVFEVDSDLETLDALAEPAVMQKHLELYQEKKGFLSSMPSSGMFFAPASNLVSEDGFEEWKMTRSKFCADYISARKEDTAPEVVKGLEKQYEIQQRWFANKRHVQAELVDFIGHFPSPTQLPIPGKRYNSIVCVLANPLSRGSCHISSPNPLAAPRIDPNYLSNPSDIDGLVHILEHAIKLVGTPPLHGRQNLSSVTKNQVFPDPSIVQIQTPKERKEKLKEFVLSNVGTVYHPMGTAAMSKREIGGVVDDKLKVYGTENLRIADLSVFPMLFSNHPQTSAYAVGEKAADILKEVHKENVA